MQARIAHCTDAVSERLSRWWPIGLPLMVLCPTVILVTIHRFDGLYGQDSYAYWNYALGLLRDSLRLLGPLPHFFWPPGYPLLVALLSFVPLVGPHSGQMVSLLAGASVPIWTLQLAREVWGGDHSHDNSRVPLMAGLLVALNGQLWQSSFVVMADTLGLAAGTLGMWALVRYGRVRRAGWLLLAAGSLAWAILTRWAYALVSIPAAAYALWLLLHRDRRRALLSGFAAALLAGAILWPVWRSAAEAVFAPSTGVVAFAASLQVTPWNPLNALRREFIAPDGLLTYRLANGLYYALTPARSFFLTPIFLALTLPGIWTVARRRRAAPLFLLGGWIGIVYGFHAGSPVQNVRFTLAYLPPLAILAAVGTEEVVGRLSGLWRPVAMGVLLAGVAWMVIGGVWLTHGFVERMNRSKTMVPWVEAQIPADAHLLAFGMTATFQHESRLDVRELYGMGEEDLLEVIQKEGPTYLIVDVQSVEQQWQGKSPADNYHWLRDGPGLTEMGTRDGYTLYRVEE